MAFNKEILRLYLIADDSQEDFLKKTESALKGGVTLVQLRMKHAGGKEFYEAALKLKELCACYQVPFVINDRVDIALAVDADGVHVGQSDLPVEVVRQILGPNKIIGVTAKNQKEIDAAVKAGADYAGAGAFVFTETKEDAAVMTLDEFHNLCEYSSIPIVGIGGITEKMTPQILAAGGSGVSVCSAILGTSNPEESAREFLR